MRFVRFKIATYFIAFAVAAFLLASCANATKTQKVGAIGAASGAVIGTLIGKKAGNTAVGAVLGGALGGAAGVLIGKRMDKQAAEIKKNVPNADVINAGEGLIVKFDSGILFDFNKADLKGEAKNNLTNLAGTMKQNLQTNILVIGHTDNVGSDSYNYALSERRASSVRDYLAIAGVSPSRITVSGKGMNEPIADNSTETGRAQNRRVEIVVVANDTMKQEAKQGAQ